MRINVMSWNMAGAKFFGHLDDSPRLVVQTHVDHFNSAWRDGILPHFSRPPNPPPDVILLQECIGFVDKRADPSGRWQTGQQILEGIFGDYSCFFFPAFSSHTHPHPARWNRFRVPRTCPPRREDMWIIAGDLNAAADSAGLELVRRVGFVDGNPDKRIQDATQTFQNPIGTKWSLSRPTAPAFPARSQFESDHAVLWASFGIE
jgi:hypothetical protein